MATTQPRGGQILDQSIKLDTPNQDVTGTLPVANGGTGNATNTINNLLVGNGTGALLALAPGTAGQVAVSNGSTWASSSSGVVLTDPKIDTIKDTNGNNSLVIYAAPSAVNYLRIDNAASGAGPQLEALGANADISIGFSPKGAGSLTSYVNTHNVLDFYLFSDLTDASFNFHPQGAGVLKVNGTAVVAVAPGTAGNVLTSNGSAWTSTAAPGGVPQKPTAGFSVAANTQVLFFTNIDMTAANGDLTVNGLLQGVH